MPDRMGREGLHKRALRLYAAAMKIVLALLAVSAAAYVAVLARVWFGQDRLTYRPLAEIEAMPDSVGLAYEDVLLVNRQGTRIHGWFVPCAGAQRTMLFLHGNAGNVSHRLPSLRLFHDIGLNVLVIDYSGYGRSGGEPSEAATRADARAAWDWLTGVRGVTAGDVVLFGRSLGGAVAAGLAGELAAEGTAPEALILESTFTSAVDMGAHFYPWLPVRRLIRNRYESVAALAGVRVPALFAHSPEDDVVPYALGRALHDGYGGPKRFLPLRGGHNLGYQEMGRDYTDGLARFLDSL